MHYQCAVWHGKCVQKHSPEKTEQHQGEGNGAQHISKVAFTENKHILGAGYL